MIQHPLQAVFNPTSIALVGASNRPGSIGRVLARNLMEGGFAGPVLAVNPHENAVLSALCYPDIAALPRPVDLAVIAVPAPGVAKAITDLGALGCRAAVVISAGFEPGDPEAAGLREGLLTAARAAGVRLVGPNCLGISNPPLGLNASFAHLASAAGHLALISQSGAIASAALDWAANNGVGFSKVASVGDAVDLDVADFLDYLALDGDTRAILLYVEGVTDARRFLSAARFAAQTKPVILIKGGRSGSGAKAAYSHTGALAGSDIVFSAAVRRAGVLQVDTMGEMFDAALLLATGIRLGGERLAILTNGGGAGVLAADALDRAGGALAELSPETFHALDETVSRHWSRRNPVDIAGDASPEIYRSALSALIADMQVDAVLVMNCPTALVASASAAEAVVAEAVTNPLRKPVVAAWLGGVEAGAGKAVLGQHGIPAYDTPEHAVGAFMHLVKHHQAQSELMQTPQPPPTPPATAAARDIVERALAAGQTALSPTEALALLKAYGVPTIDARIAATPEAVEQLAKALGGPVALKIFSPDITHKTDVGGVIAGVAPERAAAEARAMLERVHSLRPDAKIDGFLVEPMISREFGQELIVGLNRDPAFGPVVMFGDGGVYAEAIADRAVALPPLDDILAGDMISQTRVARLLRGGRGRPAADLKGLQAVLVALGQLAIDHPEVIELDINPLVVGAAGVLAVDARVALAPRNQAVRPAIAPYPSELVRQLACGDLGLTIRPVRADDAPRLQQLVENCAPGDIFFRFGAGMRPLSPELAARLSHIDYDRHMALAAEAPDGAILGVARVADDVGSNTGEFSLLVRSDAHGRDIGRALLAALIDDAEARGLGSIWGDTEIENSAMIDLARRLGFTISFEADGEIRMERPLGAPAAIGLRNLP